MKSRWKSPFLVGWIHANPTLIGGSLSCPNVPLAVAGQEDARCLLWSSVGWAMNICFDISSYTYVQKKNERKRMHMYNHNSNINGNNNSSNNNKHTINNIAIDNNTIWYVKKQHMHIMLIIIILKITIATMTIIIIITILITIWYIYNNLLCKV